MTTKMSNQTETVIRMKTRCDHPVCEHIIHLQCHAQSNEDDEQDEDRVDEGSDNEFERRYGMEDAEDMLYQNDIENEGEEDDPEWGGMHPAEFGDQ